MEARGKMTVIIGTYNVEHGRLNPWSVVNTARTGSLE